MRGVREGRSGRGMKPRASLPPRFFRQLQSELSTPVPAESPSSLPSRSHPSRDKDPPPPHVARGTSCIHCLPPCVCSDRPLVFGTNLCPSRQCPGCDAPVKPSWTKCPGCLADIHRYRDIYTHIYMYVYIYIYIYIYVYAYTFIYMYIYICTYIYIRIYVYVYIYVDRYVNVYINVYVNVYIYLHINDQPDNKTRLDIKLLHKFRNFLF